MKPEPNVTLAQFTEPKLLVPRLLSETHDGAIAELSNRLENAQRIENTSAFTKAVFHHESLVSTVFDEVAFPLARGQAVKEIVLYTGIVAQGIRWGDRQSAHGSRRVLFAAPLSAGQSYLSLAAPASTSSLVSWAAERLA